MAKLFVVLVGGFMSWTLGVWPLYHADREVEELHQLSVPC